MNDLVMLGLVDYSDNKYDMARRAQLTDGIQVAASILLMCQKKGEAIVIHTQISRQN